MFTTQDRTLDIKMWGYKPRVFRPDLVHISGDHVSIWTYVSKSVFGDRCDWRTILFPHEVGLKFQLTLLNTGVNPVP